jgi:threonine/homoserine/homoserine lactone efflux protein
MLYGFAVVLLVIGYTQHHAKSGVPVLLISLACALYLLVLGVLYDLSAARQRGRQTENGAELQPQPEKEGQSGEANSGDNE